jgi:hypothetical protein
MDDLPLTKIIDFREALQLKLYPKSDLVLDILEDIT